MVVVDAGDADHEDRGEDEAGVVHGEAQQQGVHGTGHGWSGGRQGHLRRSLTGIEERASQGGPKLDAEAAFYLHCDWNIPSPQYQV